MILSARQFKFSFPRPALVMGIVNVTPDSFSDGGQFFEPDAAVERALKLAAEGADIIDIGGESTRPGAEPVSETEELRRVLPVIERLAGRLKAPLSIDTMKPAVARAALRAGASVVNDVAANRTEGEMWEIVAEARAGYVLMHMRGTPQTMQSNPVYENVVGEVGEFFRERLGRLNALGVAADQVVLDPGIGFGKTREHNLQLLAGLSRFTKLERPLLLGISRKSFLGGAAEERLPAALACAALAAEAGAQIFRTHDVAATKQALRMAEAILAWKK
ncbi:MAG TPA: dihydropteroate synthase [Verrucomicrobiae bacterium]|nr:dihydropteroate synthase [Verrucomicrobiae bacterium]